MIVATSEELLSSVENAITVFLHNGAVEEYSLADGRRIRRSDAATLFNLRDKLKRGDIF